MSDSSILSAIKTQARCRGLNLSYLFSDYDPKGHGLISIHKFRQFLSTLGISLTDEQFEKLTKPYMVKESFSYGPFLQSLTSSPAQKPITQSLKDFGISLQIRGLNLIECMHAADNHHNGKVSVYQFLSGVGSSPLNEAIAKAYAEPPNDEIPYFRLQNDIDNAMRSSAPASPRFTPTLPALFPKFCSALQERRISPADYLIRQDKLKRGTIPTSVFLSSVLSWSLPFTPSQVEEIGSAFSKDGQFDYQSFLSSLRSSEAVQPTITPKAAVPVEFNQLIQFFRKEIVARHFPLTSFFAQKDIKGTGSIDLKDFSSVLKDSRVPLSPEELRFLIGKYALDDGKIDYLSFVDTVCGKEKTNLEGINEMIQKISRFLGEKGLRLKNILERLDTDRDDRIFFDQFLTALRESGYEMTNSEKSLLRLHFSDDSTVSVSSISREIDPAPKRETPRAHVEEAPSKVKVVPPQSIQRTLGQISAIIASKSIDLKEEFGRYRQRSLGQITSSSFRSSLMSFSSNLPNTSIDELISFYSIPNSVSINCGQFIEDIQEFGSLTLKEDPSISCTVVPLIQTLSANTTDCLLRVKAFLMKMKISPVKSLFESYDSSNIGKIPTRRCLQVLRQIGIPNADEEASILCQAFQDTRNLDSFNYDRFCIAIERIEVKADDLARISIMPNQKENAELDNLIDGLRQRLRARHRRIFDAFAAAKEGPMSKEEFKDRIDSLGLVIPFSSLQMILTSYECNLRGDVDWRRFCCDVDCSKL